ncbi:MAG TPA: hypothetical protein VF188_07645 [Longimicrobiales bacterium]
MIPIEQTVFGPRGNCMAACWASILHCPIDEVPDYQGIDAAGGSWMNAVNTWLTKHYGLLYVELERWIAPFVVPRGWHLINGDTPREGNGGHSCVGFRGTLVWDPNPAGPGIRQVDTWGLLVPIGADQKQTWEREWDGCVCGICRREGQ